MEHRNPSPKWLASAEGTPSYQRLVADKRSIFVYASDNSMHVQRLVQGRGHLRPPCKPRALRLIWSGLSSESVMGIKNDQITGIIYFALPMVPKSNWRSWACRW